MKISTGNKVTFRLYERANTHRKSGKDWALSIQIYDGESWVMKTWEKKPVQKTIDDTKEIIMRSFEVYHRHIQLPQFDLSES